MNFMNRITVLALSIACVAGGMVSQAYAQCPVDVTEVTPPVIGRTINPATARFTLDGTVFDGDTITLDASGSPVTFEFDTVGGVAGGNIAVPFATDPDPAIETDNVREAFITAVNNEVSAPATASAISAPDLPDQIMLVWKGEADGYTATNSDTGANITTRNFSHSGRAQSYVRLTGSNLDSVTSVNLNSTTSADVIAAGIIKQTATELDLHIIVVPDGVDPTVSAPAIGAYDIELIGSCSTVTVNSGVQIVDNLLNDGTFSMHFLGNTNINGFGGYGSFDNYPSPVWESDNAPGAAAGSLVFRDKGSIYIEGAQRNDPDTVVITEDPPNFGDYIWGSVTSDQAGVHQAWQTIPVNFTEPTTVTLTGLLGGGSANVMRYGAELQDQNGTVFADNKVLKISGGFIPPSAGNSFWSEFSISAEFPAGTTEIKPVFLIEIFNNFQGGIMHIDDLLLFEGEICTDPPTIDSISPNFGERDDTSVAVTVTGTNFVDGETTVKLFQGSDEIVPVSMSVNSSTQISATFDLTGVDRDYWTVSVQKSGCPSADLVDGFIVALAGPGLTNGSFELPEDLSQLDCNFGTITPDGPTDWTSIHVHPHGGGGHNRKNLFYAGSPTCPPPDGIFWASSEGPFNSTAGKRLLTQTVTVPNGTYTLSGFFAAYGPTNVTILLRDGGYQDAAVASQQVIPTGDNDWTFGYVSGDITTGLLTAEWDSDLDDTGVKVTHADDLLLEECTVPVDITSIDTTSGASEESLAGLTITGSGFSGGSPMVVFVRPGTTIFATNVSAINDTTLGFDIDLAGAGFGAMDVIVSNNGCYATLIDGFFTAPADLLNGEFEDPEVLIEDPQNPGEFIPDPPCDGPLLGEADIWSTTDPTKFRRDDTVLADALTCPNPNAAGGHYASLSTDQAETLQVWQTIKVDPGRNYLLSGWFAGGGGTTVTLRLIDGIDPLGTEIASEIVMQTSGAEQVDWQFGSVSGSPTMEFMTVIWEMTGDGLGAAASHADGLIIDAPCPSPFADADSDGDVDGLDFALFQLCISGNGNPYPVGAGFEFCACFDREGPSGPDGDVDQGDFAAFSNCYSGPEVPVNPACEN